MLTGGEGEVVRVSEPAPVRARLFVALELPEAVRDELLAWRSGEPSARDLRLIRPEALHATLCFLGWRPAHEIAQIGAACGVALRDRGGAPVLALGEVLWLPPRRPRVLAVGLEDRSGALQELQSALSEALSSGGWYTPESRPYLGHVTVARVPSGVRVRRGELTSPPRLEFAAAAVTLYRSHLERAGARYEPQVRIELH